MSFFPFGRKLDLVKEYSMEEIPVFSSLTPSEQRLIEKKARLVECKRGDVVYHEGTPSDAFYVVISGRFRLFARSRSHPEGETLIFFYRGDHFGETSLLTGRAHSASIEAKSDGVLLKLDKEDFLKLVQDVPSISLHLSRTLGHRLSRNAEAGGRREVKISALYSKIEGQAPFQFWMDFAAEIFEETKRKVVVVDFVPPPQPYFQEEFQRQAPPGFDVSLLDPSRESDLKPHLVENPRGFDYLFVPADRVEEKGEKKLGILLTFLTYRYSYILLRLPPDIGDVTFRVLKQSDLIYLYTGSEPERLIQASQVLTEFQQSFGFAKSEILVLVPENHKKDAISFEEKEALLTAKIFSLLPSRSEQPERYHATVQYLARELAGTLLGLVLGSGAAYGLAHIGVLSVLEKEGIAVDVIAGCSIGALVGALWAAGYNSDQLVSLAKSMNKGTAFFNLLGFSDFSLAHHGFFKGNQVTRFIESFLGDKTFQDLRVPLKVVASDLFSAEEVVFESGRVVDAVRASISIPGIFRPVFHRGQYLIDGGVVDPLPVRVLSKMGVKKIIAVNVLSGPKDLAERSRLREESRKRKVEAVEAKRFWGRWVAQTQNKVQSRYTVNIFNVIMNTIQFMEYEIAEAWASKADITIHPIVYEGHWAEFYSPEKFIKAGEERTREQLAEIKRLLVE